MFKPMRILEGVQSFFTSFKYWDFSLFFPPTYVVTKLTYSDRNFYEPIFLVDDVVKTKKNLNIQMR